MKTVPRSILALGALAPVLGCVGQVDESTSRASEALCANPPCVLPHRPPPSNRPPPPLTSPPDISFQLAQCLSSTNETKLVNALQSQFPQARVLASCNATERVGVWTQPESGRDDLPARQRGLTTIDILAGEVFAAHIASAFLMNQAYLGWDQAPKVLSQGGSPDPNGPIQLQTFATAPSAPSQWITTVTGTDNAAVPSLGFRLATTDTVSIVNGQIQCSTSNAFDVDTNALNVLTGVFLGLLPSLGFVFLAPVGFVFFAEDLKASSVSAPNTTSLSILCPAVSAFPPQILLPGTFRKAVFTYSRAQTDGTGITVGGWVDISDRVPSAVIGLDGEQADLVAELRGGGNVPAVVGAKAAAALFSANLVDLRTPVQFQWTASGTVATPTGTVSTPSITGTLFAEALTSVEFPMTGRESVGTTKPESVSVHLVDADNTAIDVSASVMVEVVPVPGGGIPPYCKTKPYLCRPN